MSESPCDSQFEPETSTILSELDVEVEIISPRTFLPWGAVKEKVDFPESVVLNPSVKPGEFVLQTQFAEFTVLANKKINQVLEPQNKEKTLSKLLQRGEDPNFDQLVSSLGSVAENCLPSLLRTFFEWYNRQNPTDDNGEPVHKHGTKCKGEKDYLCEKRDLAVDFLYCLVLIEVLKQLPYHPGYDDLVNHIIDQVFRHFKYKEGVQASPNAVNINMIADLYAEVTGVLAQSRFGAVKKRFLSELKELRAKDQNPFTSHCIVGLLMGMKFFRVKMHPIEELQACVQFLHECGNYFLEVKDKDIRHALAGLFVEILLPVAAVAKNEVNVPVLKNFVEMMYMPTLDSCIKRKHSLALFPMATCLLCVSQKQFFLSNWPGFLTQCLSRLKDRDPKMARVALESLYRLLWVYMIRIKCESNMATTSRLQSIVNSLFPKGSKVIMPRDTPLNIFVKIIQFIAQERRDFAMREIIYDLLCVGKPTKIFAPERMSIGLRAFLVIADSLQQREGEPPMPQTMGVLPSGNTLRFKKTFINKHLSEDTARSIGMVSYYSHVGKAFASILKHLDSQVGRPLLMIKTENANREPEEIITGEKKPKIDLFRTCVAAMPRLLPEGLSQGELVDLLSRLTVHMDDELGKLAFQALQSMLVDLPHWRNSIVRGFVQFIERDVFDTFPQLLDQCHRRLISLITQWRAIAQSAQTSAATTGAVSACSWSVKEKAERSLQDKREKNETNAEISSLGHKHQRQDEGCSTQLTRYTIEGFVLVSLCSCKPVIRKLAVVVLKEARTLFSILTLPKETEPYVLDLMDKSCPLIIERALPHLPGPEKTAALSALPLDFQWLADRTSIIWSSCGTYQELTDSSVIAMGDDTYDPWIECISIFMHPDFVTGNCSSAIAHAWPVLYNRLQALYVYIDPNTTVSDSRSSSLLRGTKKVTSERDNYVNLWKTYVVMGCCIAPPSHSVEKQRAASPEPSCAVDGIIPERAEARHLSNNGITGRDLFKTLVPLLKCDGPDMVREAVIKGLSHCNPAAFKDIVVELLPLIREAIDRKQENVKRRRKRDIVRLAVVQIFHYMAQNGIFCQSPADILDQATCSLCATFVEYIDGARMFLETEADKDSAALQEIRLHFSDFIRHLIRTVPVSQRHRFISQDLRYSLFYLFATWSGRFAQAFWPGSKRPIRTECCTALELSAVQTMSAVLCCGSVFDPSGLNDDGYIYSWMDALLGTIDQKIYRLAQETVVLLLEFNPDAQTLLDWVIDRCYTGSHEVADGCFNALGVVFNNREYPCDHVAMLNVTLLYTGCPRILVHETAVQLLHLLYKRFFLDDVVCVDHDDDGGGAILWHSSEPLDKKALEAMLLSGPYSRSQLCLSETLARLHPELTMPIFSEITHRFQTALPSVRQLLLQYLLPWLQNMELVDPNLPPFSPLANLVNMKDVYPEYLTPPLKGEGWGSAQATEMLLNNLFYITAKYGDDHAKEIEDLWATLVVCWPGNLQVIIRYIVVITGLAPNVLLPYAKRVVVYLGRAKPERLVDEMMNELSTIEPLTFNIERTPTPPYYRLTSLKKTTVTASQGEEPDGITQVISALNKGQIHTKRHSAEDSSKLANMALLDKTPRTNSTGSMRSEASSGCSTTLAPSVKTVTNEVEEDTTKTGGGDVCAKKTESRVPYPLPMPAFGGYFAPLSDMLPENCIPNPPYQRCNLAVMLLTDFIVDCVDIDWTVHLPLMLHIVFLGLDHSQQLIHEHCKQLLLNLLLTFSTHDDHFSVAKVLLGNKRIHEDTMLTLPTTSTNRDYSFIEGSCETAGVSTVSQSSASVDTLTPDSVSTLVDVSVYETKEQAAKALIEFLVTRKCQPLWRCEDITSKLHEVRSAEQLAHFQQYVLRVFHESLPQAHVDRRWAQEALHLALSCSSRHYAGRSFQVFRALCQPLSSGDLSDILSRLVETVAEQGEDMQGYVTEIMLTLEAAVDNLDIDVRPMAKELFLSTPNLVNKDQRPVCVELRKSATVTPMRHVLYYHHRSVSHNVAMVTRRAITSSPPVMETRVDVAYPSPGPEDCPKNTNLLRSRSVQSLKQLQDSSAQDDKLTILAQMFWIAVSLLESDFEYEFLLAVRLLDKVLNHLQPERPECQEKLEKILQLIDWPQFVGVQSLLLKGCTSPLTADSTWQLLSRLTICSTVSIIDPSQMIGFPMNVIALLPCLVEHYEQPNEKCREVADTISRMCQEQAENLDNLATVMTLFSRGTFAKDSLQWTKCVVKYLYDVYSDISEHMVNFIVEVLDKGPANTQNPVLQILHCLVHYVDITVLPSPCIHDLLRVVAKYIESVHWKESLKILKLCVVRSSSLEVAPPTANVGSLLDIGALGLLSHTSFAEAEVMVKKELPGRTMEFTFDQSQLPIIGGDLLELSPPEAGVVEAETSESERQLVAPSSGSLVIDTSSGFGWKRPLPSQSRTRERLINLLKCYGPRILIPKSPSVIFSHDSPSDTLERQTTMTNSSEERSIPADGLPGEIKLGDDSSTDQQIQALEAFDFLYEDPDAGYDFGGLKRDSIKTNDIEEGGQVESSRDESSDDETPVEEFPHDLPRYDSTTLLNPTVMDTRTRHRSESSRTCHSCGSVHSLRSIESEADMTDLSPTSSSPSSAGLTYLIMSSDDIEDVWRSHVNRVMTDNSGTHAVNTFHLFARLFQETRHCVNSITKDACTYLARSNTTKSLATQLLILLELLTTEMECPLVFVDTEAMMACHLVEKHKFSLLEIHESYETYLMRREQTAEHVQTIKTAMKNASISGCQVEPCSDELKSNMVSLCHCLYQLHFQLVQLYEGFLKLVTNLSNLSNPTQVGDLSKEVLELKEDLQKGAADEEAGEQSVFQLTNSVTQSDIQTLILESISSQNYQKAVQCMQQFRLLFPGDMFGVHPTDEVESVLFVYCQHQSEVKPGVIVVCHSPHSCCEQVCAHLMEVKIQVSAAVQVEQAAKATAAAMIKLLDDAIMV